MSGSTLTAFLPIPENSDGTPGLWNSRFQTLQDNIVSINSVIPDPTLLSGSTWASIGLFANSSNSDYVRFKDSSGQRSTYRLGSAAGGTADGLNIWDESGSTMIVSFSKQSVRFFQNIVGPVFDTGGALTSTLNAGTFGIGSQSSEVRIQAAVNAASAQSVERVYVPSSLYPYNSSLVSFIYPVQMVREGGDQSAHDIQAYGAYGDGSNNDRNAITQADGAAQLSGEEILFSPGTYKIASNLTIVSACRFLPGAVLSIPTGVTVTISGTLTAGTYQIFSVAGTGNVAFTPGAIPEIYPEWWGAVGDGSADDYSPVAKAIGASSTTVVQVTPSGGQVIGSITPIVFTGRHYKISDCPSCNTYQIFISRSRSIIEQTTALKAVFQLGDCVHVEVEGIQFVGGRCHLWFWNNGSSTGCKLQITNCLFQTATEMAIQAGGTSTGYTTIAATATGYTRLTGSFIDDGFVVGMSIRPDGFAANTIGSVTVVSALSMTTGARGIEAGASGRRLLGSRNNDTLNTNIVVTGCEFYQNRAVAENRTEYFELIGPSWVEMSDASTPTGTAQFVNYAGKMVLHGMFGVPNVAGTNHRWVDNFYRVHMYDCRLGSEGGAGGIGGVWHRIVPTATSSDANGTAIIIKGGAVTGGNTAPKGVVQFREGIPELLVIEDCTGIGSTPVVANTGSLVLATEFASYGSALHSRFRMRIDHNLMSSPTAVPTELLPLLRRKFDMIINDDGITGARDLVDNTIAALLDVTMDNTNDDDITVEVSYRCYDDSGGTHSTEVGMVNLAVIRTNAGALVGNAVKFGNTQAMGGGIGMTITFTVAIVGDVATLKVTNDTTNGDGTKFRFYANVRGGVRSGTIVSLASGVTAI